MYVCNIRNNFPFVAATNTYYDKLSMNTLIPQEHFWIINGANYESDMIATKENVNMSVCICVGGEGVVIIHIIKSSEPWKPSTGLLLQCAADTCKDVNVNFYWWVPYCAKSVAGFKRQGEEGHDVPLHAEWISIQTLAGVAVLSVRQQLLRDYY